MSYIGQYDFVFCLEKVVIFQVCCQEYICLLSDSTIYGKTTRTSSDSHFSHLFTEQIRMSNHSTLHFFFYRKQEFSLVLFFLELSYHSQTNILMFVLGLINFVGNFFVDMTFKQRFEDFVL